MAEAIVKLTKPVAPKIEQVIVTLTETEAREVRDALGDDGTYNTYDVYKALGDALDAARA